MMKLLKILSICLLLSFQQKIYAETIFPEGLKKKIDYFNKSCTDEDLKEIYKDKARPNRLLLIDATDPLNKSQIQYLKDNYINGIDWQDKGEFFSMVLLDNKDITKLTHVTICSPLREDQISWTMAVKKEKKIIRAYKKTINDAFDFLANQKTAAKSTRLIETLYQVYTNKRFNFLTGKRSLLIASDLMQISNEVDLRCKNGCPTFKETLSKKKTWFEITKLNLRKTDVVELYYFQTKCLVNLQTLTWWEDYFIFEKLATDNLYAKAENGVSDIACAQKQISKPIKEAKPVESIKEAKPVESIKEAKPLNGESRTPGPRILKVPRNGRTGFTS